MSWTKRDWFFCLILAIVTLLAYQPAWNGGFIWDDDEYVTNNQLLTAPDGLRRIWFSLDSPSQYFPLVYTTFRIEHALWGLHPFGYHWVNLLLHLANALLVWRVLVRLNVPGAWLAGAIFALHPVQVESVAWITERKNVLMGFFFLLTLLAWIAFVDERTKRPWRFYGLALILYMLALSAKTTACTLPAALLLILWLQKKPINRERILQIVPFFLLGLAMGLVTVWWERYHQGTRLALAPLGPVERILVASRAFWFYLGKLIWPSNLTFIYPRWTIVSTRPLEYAWSLAGAGLCAVIYFGRRCLGRGVEVAAAFFVATLSPVLGFIMLFTFCYTFVADHYQYLASIGPIALASAGVATLARAFKGSRKLIFGTAFCVVVVLAMLTWRQSALYRDIEALWRTTLVRNPACWMAYNNLGLVLYQANQIPEAMDLFKQSLRINPDNAAAHNNLGNTLLQTGRTLEAIDQYKQALRINPNYARAHNNLGNVLVQTGQTSEAIDEYNQALLIDPDYADAHNNLGNVLYQTGRTSEAIDQYEQALRLNPNYADAHNNLGNVLYQTARTSEAIDQYEQALRLNPNYADAHNNLGTALFLADRPSEAIDQYEQALRINPNSADARSNLGAALGQMGRISEAIEQFKAALRINPNDIAAQNNLTKLQALQKTKK
jgi:tetratricopeptide (TPR) repeat protein